MNYQHPATRDQDELIRDCDIKSTRRGGPGGQHRNKVESAIVVTHRPTGISGQAGERRSQHENRRVALERLRLNLAVGIRIEIQLENHPGELWESRVKQRKISIRPSHSDFPALLAEALDVLVASDHEVSVAAERLGISSSQLVKFFKYHPPALEWVNQVRRQRGLRVLK